MSRSCTLSKYLSMSPPEAVKLSILKSCFIPLAMLPMLNSDCWN